MTPQSPGVLHTLLLTERSYCVNATQAALLIEARGRGLSTLEIRTVDLAELVVVRIDDVKSILTHSHDNEEFVDLLHRTSSAATAVDRVEDLCGPKGRVISLAGQRARRRTRGAQVAGQ